MRKRMLLACLCLAMTQPLLTAARPLPVSRIQQEARVGESVEIAGTVTSKGIWHVLLHDGTNGVMVLDTYRRDFARTGDVIRACGTVEEQTGRKVVRITAHEKIGESFSLAVPIPLSVSGFRDAQDVSCRPLSVSGIVIDAFRDEFDPNYACLLLAPREAPLAVFAYDPGKSLVPGHLIDAEVRILGVSSSNPISRPYLGSFLSVSYAENVEICRPPARDPFDVPELRYDPGTDSFVIDPSGHRQRLSGVVLASWDETALFLRAAGGHVLRVHLDAESPRPVPGDKISVSGFATHDIFFTKIVNAACRIEGRADDDGETPLDITPHALLADDNDQKMLRYMMDGRLIRIKGRVINVDSQDGVARSMFLDCGNDTVEVLSAGASEIGAEVEVTGFCRFIEDDRPASSGIPRLKGFSVLTRTAADVTTLKAPPWWTTFRVVVVISILLCLVLAGLVWNLVLQKLVARKGRELARESIAHLKAELRVDERMALAVELHDTIAQNLSGISMQLEGVSEAHRIGSPRLGTLIARARHALDSCCTELRNCLWDLRNDAFDSNDVVTTVRKAIAPHLQDAAADIALDLPRSHISDSTFHALLCILRELVINAVRHGKARHIGINGGMTPTALSIVVKDDGCGFDPDNRPGPGQGHFGLQGIQERLDRLGGTLQIKCSPGNGSEFTITIET